MLLSPKGFPCSLAGVWEASSSLKAPVGFSISPTKAFTIAQESRFLSLKHIWYIYADSKFYYIYDVFLGDSPKKAYKNGLRIDGRRGVITPR